MPFVAIPQVSKVTFAQTTNGIPWFNVAYVHTSFVADVVDVSWLAEHLYAAWHTGTKNIVTTATDYQSCEVTALDTTSAPSATFVGALTGAGSAAATVPLNVCMVGSMHVATRYRGGHSRLYFSDVPENIIADPAHFDGSVAGFRQGDLNAMVVAMNALSPPSGATVEVGTVHRRRGGVVLAPPEFESWTAVTVSSNIGTQRRRLRS